MKQVKVFLGDGLSADLQAKAKELGMSLSGYVRYVLAKLMSESKK